MKALIDVHSGQAPSLADDSDLALAASEMDTLGLYAGLLMEDVLTVDWKDHLGYAEEIEFVEQEGLLFDKYDALGIGAGHDETGPFTVLIFVYESERDAANNGTVFKNMWEQGKSMRSGEPWRDIFPHTPQVTSKGRMLVAQLRTERPFPWTVLLHNPDSLLWHR